MIVTCAVDRIEENIAVLVGDDGTVYQAPVSELGTNAREGAVLRVPLTVGVPQWTRAERDRTEEATRQAAARERLKKLRRDDPGGDLSL